MSLMLTCYITELNKTVANECTKHIQLYSKRQKINPYIKMVIDVPCGAKNPKSITTNYCYYKAFLRASATIISLFVYYYLFMYLTALAKI